MSNFELNRDVNIYFIDPIPLLRMILIRNDKIRRQIRFLHNIYTEKYILECLE